MLRGPYKDNPKPCCMFCLSRCKTIVQGIKHSSFSLVAALIGNCKLYNFSNQSSLLDIYKSVIDTNDKKHHSIEKLYNEHFLPLISKT